MCLEESSLRYDERIAAALRELYGNYGYSRFKMGKFEEYELYVRNKDFLTGDKMITFTDGDGTLLALKPDVTISIIKNTQEGDNGARKVYYHENVYRTGRGESSFREIMQTGLECIGDLDAYQVFEVILLAVKSLEVISPDYMLDLSHMGLVSGIMEQAGVPEAQYTRVLSAVREKNPTELLDFCREERLPEASCKLLQLLLTTYGNRKAVLEALGPYCTEGQAKLAYEELQVLDQLLSVSGLGDRVQIDFSLVNDMGYYNGIVFQGFIKGLADGVLSGGRYDKLVEKMGKSFGAIGFAITLNELERLKPKSRDYDADVLLLYDEGTDLVELTQKGAELLEQGLQIMVQRGSPQRIRCRDILDLRRGGEAQ
jgi:ATP phosphoribosyltransferase regulatory subunit